MISDLCFLAFSQTDIHLTLQDHTYGALASCGVPVFPQLSGLILWAHPHQTPSLSSCHFISFILTFSPFMTSSHCHYRIKTYLFCKIFIIFNTRQHIFYSTLYAIARPSVCPSVIWVDQSKTIEVRIMQLSLQSSPMASFIFIRLALLPPKNAK